MPYSPRVAKSITTSAASSSRSLMSISFPMPAKLGAAPDGPSRFAGELADQILPPGRAPCSRALSPDRLAAAATEAVRRRQRGGQLRHRGLANAVEPALRQADRRMTREGKLVGGYLCL